MTAQGGHLQFEIFKLIRLSFNLALVLDEFIGIAELIVPKVACIHFDGIKTKISIIFQPFIHRFEMQNIFQNDIQFPTGLLLRSRILRMEHRSYGMERSIS